MSTPGPSSSSATSPSMGEGGIPEFGYVDHQPQHTQAYLLPVVRQLMRVSAGARVLDLGCGNGSLCTWLAGEGFQVVGVDPSIDGIRHARARGLKGARFEVGLATATLIDELGESPFDLVVSTEVVEHLYAPRDWAACAFRALKPGGALVCSTPYHGYLKNLLLAATGKLDGHFTALWDGGHIKFWSPKTISTLLTEAGFRNIDWRGAGRAPKLWMSMVVRGERPKDRT